MNPYTDFLKIDRTEKQLKLLIKLIEYGKENFLDYTYNYPNYPTDCITKYIREAGLYSSLLVSIAKEFNLYDKDKIERIGEIKKNDDSILSVTWFNEVYDILPELNPIFCESNNKLVINAYNRNDKINNTVYGKNWHKEIKGTDIDSNEKLNNFKLKIFDKLIKKLKEDLKLLNNNNHKKQFYSKDDAIKMLNDLLNNESVNRIKIYFGNCNYLNEVISIEKINKDDLKIEELLN